MQPDVDLKYAFSLKPQAAIDYFTAKGFAFSWDWHDVWQEAQAKAFTVAKVMQLDVLQDIRDALQQALDEGTTLQQFKKELAPQLKAKGWWGEVVNEQTGEVANVGPYRLRTIYETNLQTAYQAGHYRADMETTASRPWWMYVSVNDKRTRPAHSALNGLTFRFDDPFWDSHYPPNGFRCRCSVRPLGDDQLREKEQNGSAARRTTTGPAADATLATVEKPVNKQGRMATATTVKTTELDGMTRVAMAPDAGWSYNPGKTDWQPDTRHYSPEIRTLWSPP